LYSQSEWKSLGEALADVREGNGEKIQTLADSYNSRNSDGTYDSLSDSNYIIRCASGFDNEVPSDPKAILKTLQSKAPWYSQGITAEGIAEPSCEGAFGKPKLLNINFSASAPIVVVGGKNDPATPFRWSEEMTANMGDKAVLVASTGEGHSQILVQRCVDLIAKDLFTKKKLPKKGTVCKPDVPVVEPAWWKAAVSNIGGTKVDTELGNYYFSLEPIDGYARYQAIAGSATAVFKSVSQQLTKNGFPFYGSNDADPTKSPQWFQSSTDEKAIVRVWIESSGALAENGMYEPQGKLPQGTSLVMLFFVPPSE
jgi:hypothetical protein